MGGLERFEKAPSGVGRDRGVRDWVDGRDIEYVSSVVGWADCAKGVRRCEFPCPELRRETG